MGASPNQTDRALAAGQLRATISTNGQLAKPWRPWSPFEAERCLPLEMLGTAAAQ